MKAQIQRPTSAFIGASWVALGIGVIAFAVGLWNASVSIQEKGFLLTLLFYGLFSAVSLQKSVRDQQQGIPVTGLYLGLCWCSTGATLLLLAADLFHSPVNLSEKGFYAMAFVLSLFAAIAVQKNVRDLSPTTDDL